MQIENASLNAAQFLTRSAPVTRGRQGGEIHIHIGSPPVSHSNLRDEDSPAGRELAQRNAVAQPAQRAPYYPSRVTAVACSAMTLVCSAASVLLGIEASNAPDGDPYKAETESFAYLLGTGAFASMLMAGRAISQWYRQEEPR